MSRPFLSLSLGDLLLDEEGRDFFPDPAIIIPQNWLVSESSVIHTVIRLTVIINGMGIIFSFFKDFYHGKKNHL